MLRRRDTSYRALAAELVRQNANGTITRFEADGILGDRNSGDRVDIKYAKRQKMAYIEYKYSRTVQYLSDRYYCISKLI